jgi:CBS domain-containing protein
MTNNPVSINEHATLHDAAIFLSKRGISAAPVINDAGRPVGVLSRTDVIRFSNGASEAPQLLGDFVNEAHELRESTRRSLVTVRHAMTPVVLSVDLDASLAEVCEKMLANKVHRLFVIDVDETLVGVISALDVLRCLTRSSPDHQEGVDDASVDQRR